MDQGTAGPDAGDGRRPILLKQLATARHWQTHRCFRREYEKAARQLGDEYMTTSPNNRTIDRWLAGEVRKPRPDSCAVLEVMFPGHTARQLFAPCLDDDPADDQPITITYRADEPTTEIAAPLGEEEDDVNRQAFLATLAAATVAPGALLSSSGPAHFGMADVERYRHDVALLRALDHRYGSTGEVYALTVRAVRHLTRILESASYLPEVGDQLRSIAAEVMEHAGWLAVDTGRQGVARYWWLEALHTARGAGAAGIEVAALDAMSSFAFNHGRGREAVDLARTATRAARSDRPTPRLRSLLSARESVGYALNGDATAAQRSLSRAHTELDRGRHDDDSPWLDFWGPADLASRAREVGLRLGDVAEAERGARDSLAAADPVRYPRNHALYQVNLAGVLTARRNVDEALPLVVDAAHRASEIHSGRLATRIRAVVGDLKGRHGDVPAVRELVEWTATNLPASRV